MVHICFLSGGIGNFLSPDSSNHASGGQRQIWLLANELKDMGHEISFIIDDSRFSDGESFKGFNIWGSLNISRSYSPSWLLSAPKNFKNLISILQDVGADVYYTRGASIVDPLIGCHCHVSNSVFIHCIANDSDIEPMHTKSRMYILRKLEKIGLRKADLVISQTDHQSELLDDRYGIDSTTLPNAYTLPDKSDMASFDKRKYFLWVGRIEEDQKKPHRFLELAEKMPEHEFMIIGPRTVEDGYYDYIKSHANNLDNVTFKGFVEPNKIHRYYRDAIALVNTSDYEGFSNTFLESWRYETPVISLFHSPDEIIEKHNLGCRSGSIDQMADDIKHLNRDIHSRKRMGRNGRQFVERNYNIKGVSKRLEKQIRGVVD